MVHMQETNKEQSDKKQQFREGSMRKQVTVTQISLYEEVKQDMTADMALDFIKVGHWIIQMNQGINGI